MWLGVFPTPHHLIFGSKMYVVPMYFLAVFYTEGWQEFHNTGYRHIPSFWLIWGMYFSVVHFSCMIVFPIYNCFSHVLFSASCNYFFFYKQFVLLRKKKFHISLVYFNGQKIPKVDALSLKKGIFTMCIIFLIAFHVEFHWVKFGDV